MTADQRSVTFRFTQGILQAAARRGIAIPPQLSEPAQVDSRMPLSAQDALWRYYCDHANDPLCGLELGLSLQVGHLDLVGMLLMSCETLGEALDQLLEYHPIVGEGGDFALRHEGDHCHLVYDAHYHVCRRERVEAVMACVLNLARWLSGGVFTVEMVSFAASAAAPREHYKAQLDVPVMFDAGENALVFAPGFLATPLIQANTEMRDHLRQLAEEVMTSIAHGELSRQVQALLRQHPHWGKERVAECLGMSGRHLVRRLQEETVTFKLLRSTLLKTLAEESLAEGVAVADIAERLGFSDESAFAKAYKRWAGKTPSQFRNSLM